VIKASAMSTTIEIAVLLAAAVIAGLLVGLSL